MKIKCGENYYKIVYFVNVITSKWDKNEWKVQNASK